MQILRAVLCTLVLCLSGFAMTSAQNLTIEAFTGSTQTVYIYNPQSQTIIGPSGTGLAMYAWQEYNSTMLWTITTDSVSGYSYISAAYGQAEGCASGATAVWTGIKAQAVTTACSSATALTNAFVISASTYAAETYLIAPNLYPAYCITIATTVPTVPSLACNRLGKFAQWQLVSITP